MSAPVTPLPGTEPQTCASCGAALADDQRFCLSCGARRPEARGPGELRADAAPLPVVVTGPEPVLQRWLPLIVLVGVVLIALLVGLLIGRWAGERDQAAAPAAAPQVISVGTPAAAAPAAPTPAATTPAATTPSGGGSGTTKTQTTPASSDTGAATTKTTPANTSAAVKDLNSSSGADYQKKASKLPKTISTGGKAPAKDNKAPAAGGSFEDIG